MAFDSPARTRARTRFAALAALLLGMSASASAGTIIEDWSNIPVPPPPALAPVTVDAAKSALLILDMYPASCNAQARPSCLPTIPRIKALLAKARAARMLVVYGAGLVSLNGPTDAVDDIKRLPEEPLVRGAADKFFGSDLEKVLKDHKIETVIVTGTSADGAVLYTASGASMRGMQVVVPVDGLSSANRFAELYAVWHLKNTATTISRRITLTSTEQVTVR